MITITGSDLLPLVPSDHIVDMDYRQESNSSADSDIYGNPVTVVPEKKAANIGWYCTVAYVDLEVTQRVISAHSQKELLTLVTENNETFTVVIKEYPSIERFKTINADTIYTIKLGLQIQGGEADPFTIPVLNALGPRLFDR